MATVTDDTYKANGEVECDWFPRTAIAYPPPRESTYRGLFSKKADSLKAAPFGHRWVIAIDTIKNNKWKSAYFERNSMLTLLLD